MKSFSNFFFKSFKGLLFLICFCLAIWQFHLCIEKYREKPVSSSVSIEDGTKELFPAITICGDPKSAAYTRSILTQCKLE